MTPLPAAPAAKALKLHDVQRSKAMSDLELTVVLHPYSNNGELVHEHLRDHVTQILWQADPRAFEYTHRTAWADFLKQESLTDTSLLANFQILPRVASGPTFQKGLYCGGALPGALQGLSLLENYFLRRLEVHILNKTTYDFKDHFASTLLPGFTLTTEGDTTMSPLSLPPPHRPLRLKLKVQGSQACLEFHGYNYPLRAAFDSCDHPIGGGYLDKDDNLCEKGQGPYVRWTPLLDCPALVAILHEVLDGTCAPMQVVGDKLPDDFVTASSSLTSLRADPLPPQHAFLFLPFARRYLLEVPRIPLVLLSP
ncbi:unnamed protein product [Durusdinium trenchii]|uniref:Uncharacterized protein n=1 Tax=Durusdinium trenchii TaxID=1381693 RepID=A0ABP0MC11_9DINO